MRAIDMIAWERFRQQVVKHFSPEHDDQWADDLAFAAATYAIPPSPARLQFWPWDLTYWKPTPDNRIRELVKAGALICAEIDRLKRQQNKVNQTSKTKEN
jgi:hypothetical protein